MLNSANVALGHARLVVSHKHETHDMWTLEVIHELCQLGKELEPLYTEVCETQTLGQCCPAWSLPGYLALAVNRTDCQNITVSYVVNFLNKNKNIN
jgi:hypothetical protein